MIYTVFAIIICVAIIGTVGADSTTGATIRKRLHIEPYSVHKHCRKDESKPDTSDRVLKSMCVNKNRHQLSDSFCNRLSGRLPMGADCDHIVDSLAKVIDPYPTPSVTARPPQHSGPNQSSTARNNSQSTGVHKYCRKDEGKPDSDRALESICVNKRDIH
ncbi:unnamed protein product [Medioppia subpectinata]|uniref:Secreted protein n=1 Tax=Medioppia subpectinata TaxID=1979941 RepID=A0A7R9KT16_9ACAR|nr:unnamed protein product [Medioppia subpectinata]CAG2108912.1 unnamed protein product [Medioppia subpectinata]